MRRRVPLAALALAVALLTSGCDTLGYYAQSVSGHLALVRRARPGSDWLPPPAARAAPQRRARAVSACLGGRATCPGLKERLALARRIRDFAVSELDEPDNASYRRYAALKRPASVWNVVAAPELSLKLRTWCFPVVGCVGYRGYCDLAYAQSFAAGLRAEGLEHSVYALPAYSTLGMLPLDWFADPLLSTFIRYPEGEL